LGDAIADPIDNSSDFVSRGSRILDARQQALLCKRVTVANAAGLDLDSHRTRAGLRDLAFNKLERRFRAWDLHNAHRRHGSLHWILFVEPNADGVEW
jgi:hypothetical protein